MLDVPSHKKRNVIIGGVLGILATVGIVLGVTLSSAPKPTPIPAPVCFLSQLMPIPQSLSIILAVIVDSGIVMSNSDVYIIMVRHSAIVGGFHMFWSQHVTLVNYSTSVHMNNIIFTMKYDVGEKVFTATPENMSTFTCVRQTDVLQFLYDTIPQNYIRNVDIVGPACFLSVYDKISSSARAICLPFGSSVSGTTITALCVIMAKQATGTPYQFYVQQFQMQRSVSGVLSGSITNFSTNVTYDAKNKIFKLVNTSTTPPTSTSCYFQPNVLEFLKLYS